MTVPASIRYNAAGPLAGVVIVDGVSGAPITMPTVAGDGSQPISGGNGTSAASSTNPVPVAGVPFKPLGHAQLTLAATAGGAALPSIPALAQVAILQNNGTQGGRIRYDGATNAPTTTTGLRIAANGTLTWDVGQANLIATRVIADTGGVGGVLDILYGYY